MGTQTKRPTAHSLDRQHHHYLINVGRGFLGILEPFAQVEDDDGVRTYAFPVAGRFRRQSATLRKVGRSGQLVSIYLPAKLGDRQACDTLTANQHRLLQALVRETTRNTKEERQDVSEAEVMEGNTIPTINGKEGIVCNLLDPRVKYAGFNGNKVLKGRGYLLTSPGGWLTKAGYAPEQTAAFFQDLAVLTEKLALIPIGIEAGDASCLNLNQMSGLGLNLLRRLHLRVYAPADYLDRWNKTFGWGSEAPVPMIATDPSISVVMAVSNGVVSQRQLADGMGVDRSLLSKVLRGKKPWPKGWLDRATAWLIPQSGMPPFPQRTGQPGDTAP